MQVNLLQHLLMFFDTLLFPSANLTLWNIVKARGKNLDQPVGPQDVC